MEINQKELIQLAKTLSLEERKKILISYKETDLHKHIKELLCNMDQNSLVEITHGSEEHGNDLVMVNKDIFRESVIGVVVKSGNIGGRTKGRIDEIKSQVEQSLAHPVILKTIPDKKLFISEVWIMIAGNLTKGAHERLNNEVIVKGRNVRTDFGINWLVENFTNFYPQVFYEGKIMDFLAEEILQLETSVPMFSQRGKNLSDCFVEPMISKIGVPEKFDEKTLNVIAEKQIFHFNHFNSTIKPGTKILLFGDPGVGKSVVLNKYLLDRFKDAWNSAVRNELPEKLEIPVNISARKFLEFNDCEELIQHYIHSYTEIKDRIKVTSLIIDGLDEVLSTQRDELLSNAKKFSDELNCALLISTRKTDIIKNPPDGFERCELLPFNINQALLLYKKLIFDTQILDALKEGLQSIRYQVPLTPLSLFLLLKIVESRKEVPASITELYDQFIDITLGRYDIDKGIMVLFEHHIKKRFLGELAFKEFLEKKRLEMQHEEFISFLDNYSNLYGWDEEQLKEFVWEIERAGILNIKVDSVSFRHGSFIDYFGAFYIWDNREKFENLEDFIVKTYFGDFWGDVAFFYIGLQRKIDISLLNKLFDYPEEDNITHAEKLLTGRLLQAGWHSTADTRYQGIQKAINYAPIVKDDFSKLLEKSNVNFPKIFPDFFVLMLSDYSFGSRILFEETKKVLDNLANQPSYQNAYMMSSLLWAHQRFLDPYIIQKSINDVINVLDQIPEQNIEEKAKIISFLMLIGQKDEKTAKILKRKQNRLMKKYPKIFKRLLGSPKRKQITRKLN